VVEFSQVHACGDLPFRGLGYRVIGNEVARVEWLAGVRREHFQDVGGEPGLVGKRQAAGALDVEVVVRRH